MAVMRSLNQHLKQRGNRWYYQRRVPLEYADFDDRKLICKALKTESLIEPPAWPHPYGGLHIELAIDDALSGLIEGALAAVADCRNQDIFIGIAAKLAVD